MTRDEMLEILETLAHGADPETGEVLPETSPYNDTRVVRALFLAIGELRMRERQTPCEGNRPESSGTPRRAGQSWSAEEERELAAEFDQGLSIDDLAVRHDRTRGSIEARLMRLGKLAETDARSFAIVKS